MTAFALKRRLAPRAGERDEWPLLALAGLWTPAAMTVPFGLLPAPYAVELSAFIAVAAFPLVVVPMAVLSRDRRRPHLDLAAWWTALVTSGVVAAVLTDAVPIIAVALPVILIAAMVCTRYPAGSTIGVLFLTGSYGTLAAHTSVPSKDLIDLILIGLWGGVVWNYLFGERRQQAWLWPGVVACGIYIVLTIVAILGAESLIIGLRHFRITAWYMLAFLLIAYAGWGPEIHRRIAHGFVLVAAVVGAYATYRWFVGPTAEESAVALQGDAQYETVDGELRLFGSFDGGKQLAAWTAALIPFSLAFALTFKGRWSLLGIAAAGLCAVGLLGSEARAGFVGAVAGVGIVLLLYQLARGFPGLHVGITAAAVLGVLGLGVFTFTQTAGDDEDGAQRYSRLVTAPTEDPSYQARVFKWGNALEDIHDHPLGQGLGAGAVQSGRFYTIGSSSIDNSYLKIALEQGFAVMVFFIVAILLLLIGLARRAVFTASRQSAGLAIGGVGSLVALAIMMFSGEFVVGYTALAAWLVVGLGVAQFTSARARGGTAQPTG